ncbi:YggT family protein [Streptococcus cameli]
MQLIIIIFLKALEIYSYILLAYVFLSWVPSLYDTVVGRFIISLVRPVIDPLRKLNLQFAGLDWTVFVVMIALNLLSRFLWQLLYLI